MSALKVQELEMVFQARYHTHDSKQALAIFFLGRFPRQLLELFSPRIWSLSSDWNVWKEKRRCKLDIRSVSVVSRSISAVTTLDEQGHTNTQKTSHKRYRQSTKWSDKPVQESKGPTMVVCRLQAHRAPSISRWLRLWRFLAGFAPVKPRSSNARGDQQILDVWLVVWPPIIPIFWFVQ